MFSRLKIDWLMIIVSLISLLSLYQVHYNYTGKINLATDTTVGYHEVQNMRYPYPYFSDEWYAVALSQNPFKNPFDGTFFPNLEFAFHLSLRLLNPLTDYTFYSIFVNTIIILLSYIFLTSNKVSRPVSAVFALSLLYINCGANVPGLWHLIPFTYGLVFLLLTYIIRRYSLLFACIGCLFYPPLALFFILSNPKILFVLILLIPAAFTFSHRIFFTSFSAPLLPQYAVWDIMFWPIFILAFFGAKKMRWLFLQLILGIIYWFIYSQTTGRFLIEYERIVITTAIIATLCAGLFFRRFKSVIVNYIAMGILILYFLMIPSYTSRDNWMKLVSVQPETGAVAQPKAPANNYLTPDDIKIFSKLNNPYFLSRPWKGTVIGVATKSRPVVTKEGTISMNYEKLSWDFESGDCVFKTNVAKSYGIPYFYFPSFSCPGFVKIEESNEGFALYKFEI